MEQQQFLIKNSRSTRHLWRWTSNCLSIEEYNDVLFMTLTGRLVAYRMAEISLYLSDLMRFSFLGTLPSTVKKRKFFFYEPCKVCKLKVLLIWIVFEYKTTLEVIKS